MTRTTSRLSLWVLLMLGGCQSPGESATEPVNFSQEPLVHGTVDTGDPYVGRLQSGTLGCTATLIGRRTALAAAHCVAADGASATFCNFPCGVAGGCAGQCVSGTVHRYPGYSPGIFGTDFDHDTAVITLNQDFTSLFGVVPRRVGGVPADGRSIYLVGYGCTSEGAHDFGTKRSGINFINDIHSQIIDYDDTAWAYSCSGDSGGPALYPGTDCQVGIMVGSYNWAFVDNDYELARTDTKLSWIQQTSGDPSVLGCGQTRCGDGFCQLPEDCRSCPQDCGACQGLCGGVADGTQCGTDCCTGYRVCRAGQCTTGSCCNTTSCCSL